MIKIRNLSFLFLTGVLCVSNIWIHPSQADTDSSQMLTVHFINVGYGDAILIQLPDSSAIMMDSGESIYADDLIHYLESQGVKALEFAIITHPHKNHFGGFQKIINHIPIKKILTNEAQEGEEGYFELMQQIRKHNIPVETVSAGQKLTWDKGLLTLSILHPKELTGNTNDDSLVSWFRYRKISFLFTADIGPQIQDTLLRQHPEVHISDCVQIPHHGGPVSNHFAQTFSDRILVISTGSNPWGIPQKADRQKLKGTVLRTDLQGTIVLQTDGQTLKQIR